MPTTERASCIIPTELIDETVEALYAIHEPVTTGDLAKRLGLHYEVAAARLRAARSLRRVTSENRGSKTLYWSVVTEYDDSLPGDLPKLLRVPTIFAAGARAAALNA